MTKHRTATRDKDVVVYKEELVNAVRTVYKEEEVWKTRPETVTKTVTETKYKEE